MGTGIVRRIDELGRIVIPKELRRTMHLNVGDEMEIEAGGVTWLAQNTTSYPVGTEVSIDVIPFNIQIMKKPQTKEQEAIEVDV